jgi:polar amino acid transport system permease protein
MGFTLGLLLAISQDKSVFWVLRYTARSYIEIIRNTPFIVQLFFVAFGLPLLLDYQWSFYASALLAITLNFSAYFAEVVRSGIDAIDKGQLEAAKSLCLTKWQSLRDIVLPQALVKVYPSLTSQFIFLFLTTGLVSEISVEDLTWAGRFISDRNFRDFEVFIVLTVIYILMAWLFKLIFQLVKRFAFPWTVDK